MLVTQIAKVQIFRNSWNRGSKQFYSNKSDWEVAVTFFTPRHTKDQTPKFTGPSILTVKAHSVVSGPSYTKLTGPGPLGISAVRNYANTGCEKYYNV